MSPYVKPVTTIKTNSAGVDLTLIVEGAPDEAASEFAADLLDLARLGYATRFTGDFKEEVLDEYEFAFETRRATRLQPDVAEMPL